MARIKTIKENELIGGADTTDVYPVSTTQALYSQDKDGHVRMKGLRPEKLEERLEGHEEDAEELHRKAEKLVVYLNNDKAGQTLEINGEANSMVLTGSAQLETYGDEPSQTIAEEEMSNKKMTVSSAGAILYDQPVTTTTFTIPNVVGSYTSTFSCTYNGVSKNAITTVNINLRKYFGFADTQPTDPTTLGMSHFSNTVGCTVTLPATGTGFKHIYLAVPNGMTITKVTQPDALNAPLSITQVGTISRMVGSIEMPFVYKLYKSVDEVDSSTSKRLTIS